MARIILTLSLLIIIAAAAAKPFPPSSSFIRWSCRATTYPAVCVQSLSGYAAVIRRNPKQLVATALSVSIARARSTESFVYKLSEFRGLSRRDAAAVRDCLEEVSDSVDRLTKSAGELSRMAGHGSNGAEFQWHLSNLQTWVSAALTDESTCMDGFAGRASNGRVKQSIRIRMTNVAQVTSNALALCNKFAGN